MPLRPAALDSGLLADRSLFRLAVWSATETEAPRRIAAASAVDHMSIAYQLAPDVDRRAICRR
jgi:hypothetical protein